MKIGVIIGSLGIGGAERVTVTLAEWWVNEGHSVIIFATRDRPEIEYEISPRIKRVQCYNKSRQATIRLLRANLKEAIPDIVLVMDTPTCVMAVPALAGLKIPFVVSERSVPNSVALKRMTRIISHILMNYADGFVFQTEGARGYYNRKIQSRSTVIANPLEAYKIPTRISECHEKKAVAVGRLVPAKNYPFMFQAFSDFHKKRGDYSLEVYGDGPLYRDLQACIHELGAEGFISLKGTRDDVLELIKNAELFLLSSDIEGMPNALIEAMAIGIPCVSTDCPPGGPRDLIKNGINGILVPCGDHQQFVNAIEKIVGDKKAAQLIGCNAAKIRDKLDVSIIGQEWIMYFEKVLNKV